MRYWLIAALLMALSATTAYSQTGRREFLRPTEIDSIQDEQDSGKRILLYLQFAGRRIDAVRQKSLAADQHAGEEIENNLAEYNAIWDAIADTLENARQQRDALSKPLREMQDHGTAFLRYLRSLQSGSAANRDDYELTLEEAIDTTNDEIADAKKGPYPQVNAKKPPSEVPTPTPAPSNSASGDQNPEEGPPRKQRSPSQKQ